MSGFAFIESLTGPAIVRTDRVVLVRPSLQGADHTLIVLENGHEMIVRQAAADVVRAFVDRAAPAPAG